MLMNGREKVCELFLQEKGSSLPDLTVPYTLGRKRVLQKKKQKAERKKSFWSKVPREKGEERKSLFKEARFALEEAAGSWNNCCCCSCCCM